MSLLMKMEIQMNVAVLDNLRTDVPSDDEHPDDDDYWDDLDSPKTVRAIVRSLRKHGHEAKYFPGKLSIIRKLVNYRPDICFNVCEGYFGASREAQIPAMLDMLRLPYTGSGVLGMSLSHSKHQAKRMFRAAGLPTADFFVVKHPRQAIPDVLKYPLFVKPAHEGTSIGINEHALVRDRKELLHQIDWLWEKLHSPILVERYIDGREFTVSVLGHQVLPIVEIVSPTGFYSNELKEDEHSPVYRLCPAPLPEEVTRRIKKLAHEAMRALDLVDLCRMDLRMDSAGNVFILEINPLPLLYPDPEQASFVYSSRVAGISYDRMINAILKSAVDRYGLKWSTQDAARPDARVFKHRRPLARVSAAGSD
jgi:D-alanine-D-alanine ligase